MEGNLSAAPQTSTAMKTRRRDGGMGLSAPKLLFNLTPGSGSVSGFLHVFIVLSALLGVCQCGHLQLNPNLREAVRLAGDDNSFFISCQPVSALAPVGDSRVRAKELSWKKKLLKNKAWEWVVLGSQTHERVHVEQSADGRGLDLVFRSIHAEDDAEYACTATLDSEPVESNFQLNVIDPISFNPANKVQSVEEGTDSFVLLCHVSGNPRPKVTWNVRGELMRGGSRKYEVTSQGLVIRNVSKEDRGSYKCKATQMDYGITDFKDMVITLKVEHQPDWPSDKHAVFYGFISGTTNLTCWAQAEPPATFRWLDKRNNEVSVGTVHNDDHKSVLTLPISHDDTFGDYTCIADNKMGTLRKVVTLTEGAKPGIPKLDIIIIKHDSANLRIEDGKAEMYLPIIAFRVEVTKNEEDWSNVTVTNFPKDPSRTYTLPNLRPKTVYRIRAQAKNVAGLSDHSNVILLQTAKSAGDGSSASSSSSGHDHMVGELMSNSSAAAGMSKPANLLFYSPSSIFSCWLVTLVVCVGTTMRTGGLFGDCAS